MQPPAEGSRRRGARGRGRAQDVQTFRNQVASLRSQHTEPGPSHTAGRGRKGPPRPQGSGWDGDGSARTPGVGGGAAPPAGYSPRAGAARHHQSASSTHSPAGRRAGIFSIASSAAAAAAGADPHEEGVPLEEPPLSPPPSRFCVRITAPRCTAKLKAPLPAPQSAVPVPGPPPQPPPEVGLKLSELCSQAASCVLPPRPPPPTSSPAPCRQARPPPRHPGVSRRKKRRPGCARRDLLRERYPRHASRPRPAARTRAPRRRAPWAWGRPRSPASAGRLTLHRKHEGFRDLELAGTARPHPVELGTVSNPPHSRTHSRAPRGGNAIEDPRAVKEMGGRARQSPF